VSFTTLPPARLNSAAFPRVTLSTEVRVVNFGYDRILPFIDGINLPACTQQAAMAVSPDIIRVNCSTLEQSKRSVNIVSSRYEAPTHTLVWLNQLQQRADVDVILVKLELLAAVREQNLHRVYNKVAMPAFLNSSCRIDYFLR
jgi:hypothetical protein